MPLGTPGKEKILHIEATQFVQELVAIGKRVASIRFPLIGGLKFDFCLWFWVKEKPTIKKGTQVETEECTTWIPLAGRSDRPGGC